MNDNASSSANLLAQIGPQARHASRAAACASTNAKNEALRAAAAHIRRASDEIQQVNAQDISQAIADGHDNAFVDRLTLRNNAQMAEGLMQIAELPDPIGTICEVRPQPSGIQVGRMRVPLGVIGMIYEARPNVTVDAAGLSIKSGNSVILRGGREAIRTNQLLTALMRKGLLDAGLPADLVQIVPSTDRAAVDELISHPEWVDVVIPRGGKSLIERISKGAQVPVIKHLDGVCHVYIDNEADIDLAIRVADNAKTQRYAPCNTMETLLVARGIHEKVLPALCKIFAEKGVELRVDTQAGLLLADIGIPYSMATEEDWCAEYLAPILSIRIVEGLQDAMDHIARYGSQHTDAIVTKNHANAMRFLREVDSASVMVNASTRLADGFEYGLGAEIGISTDKLHARGPVGLEGLTSLKYIVFGNGHIRQS